MTQDLIRQTTLRVIRESGKENGRASVKINHGRAKELAKKWAESLKIPPWPDKMHLEARNIRTSINYLIVLDSLNFCFWAEEGEKWHIFYKGEKYDGYFALSLALKRFFDENPAKANFAYLSKISFFEFSQILGGRGNLLFKKRRWGIIRRVSQALVRDYEGNSLNFIASAKKDAVRLAWKIFWELPSFNDFACYRGRKVYFLKRAQILVADIFGALKGRGIANFHRLEKFTAFADYKLPQILNYYGILEYSPRLENKIKNRVLIAAGSAEETEIRSATIWAVEYLKQELARLGKKLRSFEVDWILWNKSQKQKMVLPYHRTKTIFY